MREAPRDRANKRTHRAADLKFARRISAQTMHETNSRSRIAAFLQHWKLSFSCLLCNKLACQ
jgi:hypothetical protein